MKEHNPIAVNAAVQGATGVEASNGAHILNSVPNIAFMLRTTEMSFF